jgi:2-polyprenyl-3-methyl-5-hydroxy-6-metoxy-1,4-benzoquinol methylase
VERDDWNRKHGQAGPLFGVEPNRFLVAEVSGLPPGRALDVACGAGRNAVWLAERGWSVTGVDFSDVALENARQLAEERGVAVEWVDGDLRNWQPPGEYDLVAVLYLHVPA